MYYTKTPMITWNTERNEYECHGQPHPMFPNVLCYARPHPMFAGLSDAIAYAAEHATEEQPTLLIQSAQPYGYVWPDSTLLLCRDAEEFAQ